MSRDSRTEAVGPFFFYNTEAVKKRSVKFSRKNEIKQLRSEHVTFLQ